MMRFGPAGRLILGSVIALLPVARAMAATPATMMIGESQLGKVKGNKPPKGGTVIELLSVSRPGTDAVGKRTSAGTDTLVITKYFDSNSTQLEQAAATNEVLHQVTIVFETSAAGSGAATNSKVKGGSSKNAASGTAASASKTAHALLLKNVQVDEIQQTRNLQRITIEYQSIEVTYTSGKAAAELDDWETP